MHKNALTVLNCKLQTISNITVRFRNLIQCSMTVIPVITAWINESIHFLLSNNFADKLFLGINLQSRSSD